MIWIPINVQITSIIPQVTPFRTRSPQIPQRQNNKKINRSANHVHTYLCIHVVPAVVFEQTLLVTTSKQYLIPEATHRPFIYRWLLLSLGEPQPRPTHCVTSHVSTDHRTWPPFFLAAASAPQIWSGVAFLLTLSLNICVPAINIDRSFALNYDFKIKPTLIDQLKSSLL